MDARNTKRLWTKYIYRKWLYPDSSNTYGEKAEGADWQRQRKLTATPVNEQKSVQVCYESLRQSNDMLQQWLSRSLQSKGFTTTPDDTRTLALYVLAFVAFQRSYSFQSKSKTTFTNAKAMTYRDSLALILKNALIVMVLPESTFSLPFLPSSLKEIGLAIQRFREYMIEQVAEERRLVQAGQPGIGTLVSNLVRAGEAAGSAKGATLKSLSESEILGNIFVFNFAGHDTTAISTAFAMLLLVAHPEVQAWVSEELRIYLPKSNPQTWAYNEAFPNLKRCLAVLLETLCLYNPLPGVPKYTGAQSQSLAVNDHTYLLPADMLVVPNIQASHTHPRTWGNDSLTWRPQRWIEGSGEIHAETIMQPPKGTYFPWSDGARNCPGKRFAQVEFVAVMAALFRDHYAEPVPRPTEDLSEAQARVLSVVKDSSAELLLQMRNPESVAVKWRKRE